jgi:enamine deaminase RidA (YjgF/YER057c/UK114 family)
MIRDLQIEDRITELGLKLPDPPRPLGAYLPVVRVGNLVFVSGMLPRLEGRLVSVGKLGQELNLKDGQEAARLALLNGLAAIKSEIRNLAAVKKFIRLNCYVNSALGFTEQAQVADGASNILLAVFGEAGRHSRVSVGVAELPGGAAVELDLIVEVEPRD